MQKRFTLLIFVLFTALISAKSQSLYIKATDGTITAKSLATLARFTFSSNNLLIKYQGGTVESYSLSNISKLTFLQVPTVTTQAVTDVAETTATGNGNITDLGSPTSITAYGVCWSSSSTTPTVSDNQVSNGTTTSSGAFTASITGLVAGTTYYVRAYATNVTGTAYGDVVSFTTTSTVTGVDDLSLSGTAAIKIYPNPVSDIIYIQNAPETSYLVSIYRITGASILSTKMNSGDKSIDVSFLQSGLYLMNINGLTLKFVKL
jgi:hypothetical protein